GDSTLLCITGGSLQHPDPEQAAKNFVFDLLRSDGVRGAIVLSSAIGNNVGAARLTSWLERYRGITLCSAGVALKGYPSVCVDSSTGIAAGVRHLLRQHAKQAIGFIRGPAHSAEAEERLEAYRSALREEGIEPEARYIVDGNFLKESGVQAVRT